MIKVSDALMPRVIEAGATLLYYFAQETWDRFGEDGIHFIDKDGVDRNRYVIWYDNLQNGQYISPSLSSYRIDVDAIGPVANRVEFYLDGTFLRSSPISEYKGRTGTVVAFVAKSL